jgi:hypothetical protein
MPLKHRSFGLNDSGIFVPSGSAPPTFEEVAMSLSPYVYLKFDDAPTTYTDSSGNGINWTPGASSNATRVASIVPSDTAGFAAHVSNNSICQHSSFSPKGTGGSFTVALWYKPNSSTTTGGLYFDSVPFASSFIRHRLDNVGISFETRNQGSIDTTNILKIDTTLSSSEAHLIVASVNHNTQTQKLYLNDGSPASFVFPGTWNASRINPGSSQVGRATSTTANGVIDEFLVYRRALTDQEVLDLYNAGIGA